MYVQMVGMIETWGRDISQTVDRPITCLTETIHQGQVVVNKAGNQNILL